MATHALASTACFEGPEDDVAGVICGGERLSVGGARYSCDVAGVSGKEAQTITAGDMPHADCAVARACEDIEVIRVESDAVDVVVVANIDAKRLNVVGRPQTRGAVV